MWQLALPVLFGLAPMMLMIGILEGYRRMQRREDRRSPLTRSLKRLPAHGLEKRMEELQSGLVEALFYVSSLPGMFYALYLQHQVSTSPSGAIGPWIYATAGAAVVVYAVKRALPLFGKEGRAVRLGIEAERAVGEALDELMRSGYFVFHDCPGEPHFNLDHVVVGPAGVFVVETKGRPKRERSREDGHVVRYDGKALRFPEWQETKPLLQAELGAKWLSEWLARSVGEKVVVQPVVILPGWYVERTSGQGLPVLNEKQAVGYFSKARGAALSEKLVTQIVYQLDQRCRDIEPRAYADAKGSAQRERAASA